MSPQKKKKKKKKKKEKKNKERVWGQTNRRAAVWESVPSIIVQPDQSSISASRNFASLAIQNALSEDSDQTVQMCMLMWMFAGHMQEGTLSDVWAHRVITKTPWCNLIYI